MAEPDQRVGLVAVKTSGSNQLFEFGAVGLRVIQRRAVALEQRRGGEVDPLVGALGRQDGGHRQFKRIGEIQLAVNMRKRLRQCAIHPAGAADQADAGFVVPLPR